MEGTSVPTFSFLLVSSPYSLNTSLITQLIYECDDTSNHDPSANIPFLHPFRLSYDTVYLSGMHHVLSKAVSSWNTLVRDYS